MISICAWRLFKKNLTHTNTRCRSIISFINNNILLQARSTKFDFFYSWTLISSNIELKRLTYLKNLFNSTSKWKGLEPNLVSFYMDQITPKGLFWKKVLVRKKQFSQTWIRGSVPKRDDSLRHPKKNYFHGRSSNFGQTGPLNVQNMFGRNEMFCVK